MMVKQSVHLLHLSYDERSYLLFTFFSTLCSYNFHWALSPAADSETIRVRWTKAHKPLQYILIIAGFAGAAWFALPFLQYWFWLGISVILTFLYSAPKLPLSIFDSLKKIAIGKTIFLSFVWAYVTTALPIIIDGQPWDEERILFLVSRFFLIYSICIIFDKRDREQDRKQGIRSMVTYFSENNVRRLFQASLLIFFISTMLLFYSSIPVWMVMALLAPGLIVWNLYNISARNYSDYLYYFILDGLMMLSALFTSLTSF